MSKKTKPAVAGYDGERRTALESIRLFCRGCMGGSPSLVSDCPSSGCTFYAYRSGVIADGASRRLLRVIKAYCDGCAPGGDVADCTAGKGYLSLSACPIWPFRLGRSPYYGDVRRERLREHAIRSGSGANFRPRLDRTTPTHVLVMRSALAGNKRSHGHD